MYPANQGEVWDAYESCDDTLDRCLTAFPLLPGQKGILVYVNGNPAGLDIVSREAA